MEMNKTLINQVEMPVPGFGTWKLADGPVAFQAVTAALEVGYRHIDTAQNYGNEESVGRAIKESGLDRQEIFLTTKVWNNQQSYEDTLASVEESLNKLQTSYLDLLLIHWPNPIELRENEAWKLRNTEVWRALESLYQAKKVRTIGVSNFQIKHLEALFASVSIKPMVNQIILTPGLSQDSLVQFCREHEMLLEAYSPLGQGEIFKHAAMIDLANKYDRTVGQVALRWSIQKGFAPLPRSQNPDHIRENLNIFDFELDPEDMEFLDQLTGIAQMQDPDTAKF